MIKPKPTYIHVVLSVFVDICSSDVGQLTAARAERYKISIATICLHLKLTRLRDHSYVQWEVEGEAVSS